MQTKSIAIGAVKAENNIFLAPMAGYTDYGFRRLLLSLGFGFCFTELVSAKGLCYGAKGTKPLLKAEGCYNKTAVQLFGEDPYFMRSACESEQLKEFNVVDINMGCPVPKVYKNGEGSALLKNVLKAELIIKECVKSGKIITVKIRTGLKRGDNVATEFAKMAENAGASLITIHGRVREDYYSGEPDYNAISGAKNNVKIPVIANGGIFTVEDADKMINLTGADGVMLARGGVANPFIALDIQNKPHPYTIKEFMLKHLSYMQEELGETRSAMEFRKYLPYYLKGERCSKKIRIEMLALESSLAVAEYIEKNL